MSILTTIWSIGIINILENYYVISLPISKNVISLKRYAILAPEKLGVHLPMIFNEKLWVNFLLPTCALRIWCFPFTKGTSTINFSFSILKCVVIVEKASNFYYVNSYEKVHQFKIGPPHDWFLEVKVILKLYCSQWMFNPIVGEHKFYGSYFGLL